MSPYQHPLPLISNNNGILLEQLYSIIIVDFITSSCIISYMQLYFLMSVTAFWWWVLSFFFLQWVPEITHHCPKTPFLLVGTQIDLRDDPSTVEKLAKNKQKPITPETAEKLARDLKAVKYVECSALTQVRSPM